MRIEPFQKVIVARWIGETTVKNSFVDVDQYLDIPLYFFAGPIQGAVDWQLDLFRLLGTRLSRFIAVVPTRYSVAHPLYPYRMEGTPEHFSRQRHLEAYYIKKAREALLKRPGGGGLLFNLCCQTEPRADGRPYATDSWREASETYTRLEYEQHLSVLVCANQAFPGREILKDCFDEATGGNFPFYQTLEELAHEASLLAHQDSWKF